MRAISCLVLLSGCYLAHGRGEEPDAGVPVDASARDATVSPDLSSTDSGSSTCRPAAVDGLCFGDVNLVLGDPPSVNLSVLPCSCGGWLRCRVTEAALPVDGAPGQVYLEVDLCDEERCDACAGPTNVTCALPSLPGGSYEFRAGEAVFTVAVPTAAPTDPVTGECQTPASTGGLCDPIGLPYVPRRVCMHPGQPIRISGGSSCDHDPGPCSLETTVARLGNSFELVPRQRSCDEYTPAWDCENWECPRAPLDGTAGPVTVGGIEIGVYDPSVRSVQCFDVPAG